MTIAKKHAQQYMPNGELSLEQVIQAAIDEADSLLIVGARERVRDLEWANDQLKDHAIALQERIRQLEKERVPDGHVCVPAEMIERFPEINQHNYNHDDVCELNAWGIELFLAAAPAQEISNG